MLILFDDITAQPASTGRSSRVWVFPTSILQRKKCFCIDENIACRCRRCKAERDSSITDSHSSPSKDNEFITTFKQDIQGHKKGLNKEEKQNLKDAVKSIYSPRRLADGEAMMCEIQGAQEDFVRRWEMCFREYPDILTEPKNNEKLLIFIDRASRYLQMVKDRLNNDGNPNSQTV